MSAVVAAELLAGCRNRRERRNIETLLAPFRRVHRLVAPRETDTIVAGKALSRLRERSIELRNPGAALLDALVAATCVGIGAMLISHNAVDFERLASEMPLRFTTYAVWASARP
jgi:predicted nucleic acid-binding protein